MKTNDTHESVSRIAGRGLVLVSLLAVALAFAASSFAQSNAAPAPNTADAKAAQPAQAAAISPAARAAKAPRGTGEGIQIHGWWTIEIRNRDGSVAKHVEFENALVSVGPAVLAGLLSGNLVAGSWELGVVGYNAAPPSGPCSSSGGPCEMVTAGSGLDSAGCTTTLGPVPQGDTQPACYATLTPSLTGGSDASYAYSSFTLNGQAYVDASTSITTLRSAVAACGSNGAQVVDSTNTNSPSTCYGSLGTAAFTEYDFYPALSPSANCGGSGQPLCEIPVQAGQVIAASVTFSFSSPSGDGQSTTPALARPHPILRAPASTKPTASTPVTQ